MKSLFCLLLVTLILSCYSVDVFTYTSTIVVVNYISFSKIRLNQDTVQLSNLDINSIVDTFNTLFQLQTSYISFSVANSAKILYSLSQNIATIEIKVSSNVPIITEFEDFPTAEIYRRISQYITVSNFNSQLIKSASNNQATSLLTAYAASIDNSIATINSYDTDLLYFTSTFSLSNYNGDDDLNLQFQNVIIATLTSIYFEDSTFYTPAYIFCPSKGIISGKSITVVLTTIVPQDTLQYYGQSINDQYAIFVKEINSANETATGSSANSLTGYLQQNLASLDYAKVSGLSAISTMQLISIGQMYQDILQDPYSDSNSMNSSETKKSLSGGAIFGILLLVLVFIVAAIVIICRFCFEIDIVSIVFQYFNPKPNVFKQDLKDPLVNHL